MKRNGVVWEQSGSICKAVWCISATNLQDFALDFFENKRKRYRLSTHPLAICIISLPLARILPSTAHSTKKKYTSIYRTLNIDNDSCVNINAPVDDICMSTAYFNMNRKGVLSQTLILCRIYPSQKKKKKSIECMTTFNLPVIPSASGRGRDKTALLIMLCTNCWLVSYSM